MLSIRDVDTGTRRRRHAWRIGRIVDLLGQHREIGWSL
jgi:hypothetical protein